MAQRRATIDDGDPAEQILGAGLGVFDENIEIAIGQKRVAKSIEQLVLGHILTAAGIFFDQIFVRERHLRIF